MFARANYPAGVPCWVDTRQPDPDAAVAFYGALFGWDFTDASDGQAARYHLARLDGRAVAGITSAPDDVTAPVEWTTYVCIDRVDDAVDLVAAAGGQVLAGPFDLHGLGHAVVVADPTGARFRLWQPAALPGAEAVNEPGTWNWSTLHTRDLAAALAFYGELFGWEHSMIAPGVEDYGMVGLPGYGDLLDRLDPDLDADQAEVGAPEGFEDAAAWAAQLTDDELAADAAPHWSITFAVDDTDRIVDHVVELGGKILIPPFDFPPVRTAVAADPQGAMFSVSPRPGTGSLGSATWDLTPDLASPPTPARPQYPPRSP